MTKSGQVYRSSYHLSALPASQWLPANSSSVSWAFALPFLEALAAHKHLLSCL